MRLPPAAAALLTSLVLAAPASAADPIMPLSQVRAGMQCTALTVLRGTDISSFSIEVLDVVDGEAAFGGPQILIRSSGPGVDDTGMGQGFSGSPILCPDAAGVPRTIGAISGGIGEYGGEVGLATPIEAILGNPVDPPSAAREDRALMARARPFAVPLTVSGLSPALGAAVQAAAARAGRVVLAAPAGPLGSFPVQTLRPGASVGVGYATGDVRLSGIGTVTYVDGSTVWAFGHPLEGLGRRALFLQDAYVYRVVSNPLGLPPLVSYKLAATGHDVGTLTNDALSAVVGRVGALPPSVPVRVRATDVDAGRSQTLSSDVADESGVDQPTGFSALSLVAPLVAAEAAGTVLRGSPARLSARACVSVALRQLAQPARFCNRYVTDVSDFSGTGNAVGGLLASDLIAAIGLVDAFQLGRVDVTGVRARVRIERGEDLAFLRRVELPRRVRAGQRVPATLVLRHVRAGVERRRVRLRMPPDLRPGRRRVILRGVGVDFGASDLFGDLSIIFEDEPGDGAGPATVEKLGRAIRRLRRYDGLRILAGSAGGDERGRPVYRAADVRIAGRATTRVRVVGPRPGAD